ncbi:MAG: branched-chain amino acid ABC transporter permease [Armatimonadota bacterium]|nr:branched-chain amino acid ABC transporter permease [Armatimonadota bacterium]
MSAAVLAQSVVFGLLAGALYGLAAAGLSLVFGVLRVLNVAHGELIMLGGYASFWLFTLTGFDPFASLAVSVPLMFVVGLGLHQGLFARVETLPEEARIKNSLLLGFGLALALHNLAIRLWTADDRAIAAAYTGVVLRVGGLVVPAVRLAALLIATAMIGAVHLFLTRTDPGRAIRAVAEDWEAALLVGIDLRRAYLLAFALGSGLAGAAGTLVAVGYSINPGIGLEWTLKALIVVVLAGLGSMPGTLAGGLLLGAAESGSALVIGGVYREVVALALFVLVLMVRPQGLFGRR